MNGNTKSPKMNVCYFLFKLSHTGSRARGVRVTGRQKSAPVDLFYCGATRLSEDRARKKKTVYNTRRGG